MIMTPISRRYNDYLTINKFFIDWSVGPNDPIVGYGDKILFINEDQGNVLEWNVRKNELQLRFLSSYYTDEEAENIKRAALDSDISDDGLGTQIIIFLLRSISREVDGDKIRLSFKQHFGCNSPHKIINNYVSGGLVFREKSEIPENEEESDDSQHAVQRFADSASGFIAISVVHILAYNIRSSGLAEKLGIVTVGE